MKDKKGLKISLLLLAICFIFSSIVTAQEEKKAIDESTQNPDGSYSTDKFDEATRPEDSYLAKLHAIEVVNKLMKKNLEQIYLLKVIVSNFPDNNWQGEYDKAYQGYKRAMELYYKRNIIYSRVEFETNKKAIKDLMKKILVEYKKQTQNMLNECADRILLLHLDARTRSDPSKNRELRKNQLRLQIAYGQFDDALNSEIENYLDGAIYHYRVSKSYAIKILEDLTKPEEQENIKQKFKLNYHKADNLNRIFEKKAASGGGSTTPEKKEETTTN